MVWVGAFLAAVMRLGQRGDAVWLEVGGDEGGECLVIGVGGELVGDAIEVVDGGGDGRGVLIHSGTDLAP